MDELSTLKNKANQIYLDNFPNETRFERSVFFSWGCTINDCGFCYMSAQPKDKEIKETKRSLGSVFAEVILVKHLRWDLGFFTGGIGVYSPNEMELLLKKMYEILGQKVWLNIGALPRSSLQKFKPYLKGIVGSTETIEPELHKKICPSKPLDIYEKMFSAAKELDIPRAMTFIVGMGEDETHLKYVIDFIKKYEISKIHLFSLTPHPGTMLSDMPIPSKEYHAWWISQLRIAFPKLDIQCGIWVDRVDRISFLLNAGANSFAKFKGLELFGTPLAHEMEDQVSETGREFKSNLTKIPNVDFDAEVAGLDIDDKLKSEIKIKLDLYLKKMKDNCKKNVIKI
jgi:biotin synthase-like enzyme